jgi:hypothetical protein
MSLCENCFKGVTHEGTPSGMLGVPISMYLVRSYPQPGTVEKLNGVDCYIATPSGDYDKTKVLLLLTDIFGWEFVNNRVSIPTRFVIQNSEDSKCWAVAYGR